MIQYANTSPEDRNGSPIQHNESAHQKGSLGPAFRTTTEKGHSLYQRFEHAFQQAEAALEHRGYSPTLLEKAKNHLSRMAPFLLSSFGQLDRARPNSDPAIKITCERVVTNPSHSTGYSFMGFKSSHIRVETSVVDRNEGEKYHPYIFVPSRTFN